VIERPLELLDDQKSMLHLRATGFYVVLLEGNDGSL